MTKSKIVILVASLMALGALSIDTMLPALSMIKSYFEVTSQQGHWIITTVFLGISVGQLIFGPISDSIGRKKTALIGLLIFGLGNLMAIFSTDYNFFLFCRFFQGLGAGATVVVSRAIARDLYTGSQLAQIMSIVSTIFILVPVLAPIIGQLIISAFIWQSIPLIILLFCLLLGLWSSFFQIETNKQTKELNFHDTIKGVLEVFRSRISRSYTISAGLTFGILVSFLNISQPLFQEFLLVGENFALFFALGALAVGLGSIINATLVTRIEPKKIVRTSLKIEMVWSVFYLIFFLIGGKINVFTVMLFLIPTFFIFGTLFGNMNALAISPMGHIAGTASAIIGTSTTLIALPIGSLVAYYFSGSLIPFLILIIFVTNISLFMTKRIS